MLKHSNKCGSMPKLPYKIDVLIEQYFSHLIGHKISVQHNKLNPIIIECPGKLTLEQIIQIMVLFGSRG